MTKIKKLIDIIDEEICGAKQYAECYVEQKVKDNAQWANRYKEMSQDELKHAMYMHELCMTEIEKFKQVITPPEEMIEKWEKAHNHYVEKASWIKQMLSM